MDIRPLILVWALALGPGNGADTRARGPSARGIPPAAMGGSPGPWVSGPAHGHHHAVGAHHPCKTCEVRVPVATTKKETTTVYSVRNTTVCVGTMSLSLHGLLCHTPLCPRCSKPIRKKVLIKRSVTTESPDWKCEVKTPPHP